MTDDALAEALALLRSADRLCRVLPRGARDREMIEAHMLVLDREIHALLSTSTHERDDDIGALQAASRATRIRVAEVQSRLAEPQ